MFGLGGLFGSTALLPTASSLDFSLTLFFLKDKLFTLLAALAFATPLAAWINTALARGNKPGIILDLLYPLVIVALLAICLMLVTVGDVQPLRFFTL
jgi:hypothetical protein